MKIILASIIALFASNSTFAQITPKSYILGGGIGFGFIQNPGDNQNHRLLSFRISPSIGKFASEKYLFSGGVGFNMTSQKSEFLNVNYPQSNTRNGYGINAQFGVTRFFPLTDRLYFTFGGRIGQTYTESINETNSNGFTTSSESSEYSSSVSFSPGFTYFINKKWMIDAYVGFVNYRLSYDIESKQVGHNVYLTGQGNNFGLGMRYVIGAGTND